MNAWIAWFAQNHVAATLLMVVIVATGLLTATTVRQEFFPEVALDIVMVTVPFPGAAPEDIERGILQVIEQEIEGVDGIKEYISIASEDVGVVSVEIDPLADRRRVIDDVKSRVEAIDTFPEDAERPIVQELIVRILVLNVALYGEVEEQALKELGEEVRESLIERDEISVVELTSVRPYEIAVEVDETILERHGLTFDFVVSRLREHSLDLPGGQIRAAAGEVSLRTSAQAFTGDDFAALPLLVEEEAILRVEDVAAVRDDFADVDREARFNDAPAVMIEVYRVGEEDALEVQAAVLRYLEETEFPPGVQTAVWRDVSRVLRDRLDTLMRNGLGGFILVIVVLALFLQLRLAIWVSLSVPVAFLGALLAMPLLEVTVNMISLFAFILALGILVDAAIVSGESIYARNRKGGVSPQEAAIEGVHNVATPIVFAVLTSVVAFAPALFIPGVSGQIWAVIPTVVIAALLFSLVVSLLILPARLSRLTVLTADQIARMSRKSPAYWWNRVQLRIALGFEGFVERVFQPVLRVCLRWRYLTVACGVAVLLLAVGAVRAELVRFVFFPEVEADDIIANLRMPEGTTFEATANAVRQIERAAIELQQALSEEYGREIITNIFTQIGESTERERGMQGETWIEASNLGGVTLELAPAEERPAHVGSEFVLRQWRERVGEVPGARELRYNATLARVGDPIDIQLTGRELDELRAARHEVRAALRHFDGVFDIADTFEEGMQEVRIVGIKPEARASGIELGELARQVRAAFFGAEVQRVQRGRDEVIVYVRYPRRDRESLGNLERMRIRLPDGRTMPFEQVAEYHIQEGFASIRRVDGRRAIHVRADVDTRLTTAGAVLGQLGRDPEEPARVAHLPTLEEVLAPYPGVSWDFVGERREQDETIEALTFGFTVALFVIYALLAIPLRSYVQPFLIMLAIPFGIIGALGGHMLFGLEMSVLSLIGIVALGGVVVNASLVLIDFINRNRRAAERDATEAVVEGSMVRFRPIVLTALTTFAGLTPIMLETSLQAQFLIPMAVSLAFGVLFSTLVTMLLVPAAYLIVEDVKRLLAHAGHALRTLYARKHVAPRLPAPPSEPSKPFHPRSP